MPTAGRGRVNRKELAALADLARVLDEITSDLTAHGNGLDNIERLALAKSIIGRLADGMKIASNYPQQRELPLEYLQKDAEFARTRLAELKADRIGAA